MLLGNTGTISYNAPAHPPRPNLPRLPAPCPQPPRRGDALSPREPKPRPRACSTAHAHVPALPRTHGARSLLCPGSSHGPPSSGSAPSHPRSLTHFSPKALCNLQALCTQKTERLWSVPPASARLSTYNSGGRESTTPPQLHPHSRPLAEGAVPWALRRRTWSGQLTWRAWRTCSGRRGQQVGAQAACGAGVGAEPAALQQCLQGARLARLRMAAETRAAALGVYAAWLAFAQSARQAAAAARLAHHLGARGRRGLALGQRARVARFAAHHRASARRASTGLRRGRPLEQRQSDQRRCQEQGARPLHGAHCGCSLLSWPGLTGTG